jgi:putative membrane protein
MKNSTLLLQGIMASVLLAGCNQTPTTASTPATDAAQAPAASTSVAAPAQPMTQAAPNTQIQAQAPNPAPPPNPPAPTAGNPPANNYPANPPPVAYGPPPPAYPPPNRYPPPPPRAYPGRPIGGPPDAGMDANFFRQALAGGEMEVRLSQLGVSHSQNPQIRRLAQMMIRDHNDLNAELSAVSRISRVPVGDEITIAQLAGMSGPNFDQRYLADLLEGHRNAIALFQDAARNARSDATRRLAVNALPKLQGHLGAVQRAQQAIGQNYPRR